MTDFPLYLDRGSPFVVFHPARMAGEATVGHSRLPCSTLAGHVWAGDAVDFTAEGFQIPEICVEVACWWMAVHAPPRRYRDRWHIEVRRHWAAWAEAWDNHTWYSTPNANYPHPGHPPSRHEVMS